MRNRFMSGLLALVTASLWLVASPASASSICDEAVEDPVVCDEAAYPTVEAFQKAFPGAWENGAHSSSSIDDPLGASLEMALPALAKLGQDTCNVKYRGIASYDKAPRSFAIDEQSEMHVTSNCNASVKISGWTRIVHICQPQPMAGIHQTDPSSFSGTGADAPFSAFATQVVNFVGADEWCGDATWIRYQYFVRVADANGKVMSRCMILETKYNSGEWNKRFADTC